MRKLSPAFFIVGFIVGVLPILEISFSTPPGEIPRIEYERRQTLWGSTGGDTVVDTDPDAVLDPDVAISLLDGAFAQVDSHAQMVSIGLTVGLFALVRGGAGVGLGLLGAAIVTGTLQRLPGLVEVRADDVLRLAGGTFYLRRGAGYWALLISAYAAAAWSLARFVRLTRQARANRASGREPPVEP